MLNKWNIAKSTNDDLADRKSSKFCLDLQGCLFRNVVHHHFPKFCGITISIRSFFMFQLFWRSNTLSHWLSLLLRMNYFMCSRSSQCTTCIKFDFNNLHLLAFSKRFWLDCLDHILLLSCSVLCPISWVFERRLIWTAKEDSCKLFTSVLFKVFSKVWWRVLLYQTDINFLEIPIGIRFLLYLDEIVQDAGRMKTLI